MICVLVRHYLVEIARLNDPALRERATIVVDRLERGRALDVDGAAFALGARAGMTLVQASACAREAAVAVADGARAKEVWEAALEALDAASPLVEDAAPGEAYLEMRGIEGTPQRWVSGVRTALAECEAVRDVPFRIACASNKFAARAAAFVADGTIVAAGEERAFAAPLPVHVLDLHAGVVERLRLLGVRTLGQLAALPHGPFVRRFGPEAATWHARARGRDDVPLVPRPRALRIDRSLYGEGSAEREDQLLFALRTLVARVAEDVAYAGKRCGLLRLTLECEDGDKPELQIPFAQPTAQTTTMFDLIRARLEGIVLQSPVNGLRLGAERLEEGGTERSLFAANDPDPEAIAIALARLEAALGPRSGLRARVTDGNRYETRFAYEPFASAERVRPAPEHTVPPAPENRGTLAFRLLAPREIAVTIEGGRPARIDGQRILDVAGPWRADEQWWASAHASDAYDVALADGSLWRIVDERGRWYVSGTYD